MHLHINIYFEQEWARMAFENPVPTNLELDGIDKILTRPFIDKDFLKNINCTDNIEITEKDIEKLRDEFLLVLPTKVQIQALYSNRVKFSNFYLLIGWRIKSYFANSENFWPCGLHKGQKRPKNEILAYESE